MIIKNATIINKTLTIISGRFTIYRGAVSHNLFMSSDYKFNIKRPQRNDILIATDQSIQ